MDDLISRQAAIDALEKVADMFPWRVPGNRDTYDRYNEAWNDAIGRAEMEIENMTSAQPTVDAAPIRRGEWVDVHFRTVPYDRITGAKKCPYCGKKKDKYVQWNWCPNCGAKMDERNDGDETD